MEKKIYAETPINGSKPNNSNQIVKIKELLFGEDLNKQKLDFIDLSNQIENLETKQNEKISKISDRIETLFEKLNQNIKQIAKQNDSEKQQIETKVDDLKKGLNSEINNLNSELKTDISILRNDSVLKTNLADVFLELAKQS